MARIRPAEHALRLLTETPKRQHVCRTCRAQQTRFFASTPYHAEDERKWAERLKERLFGSKRDETLQKREAEAAERTRNKARGFDSQNPYVTRKAAKDESHYRVAPIVDPEVTEEYVLANDWDGLQIVGTKQWIRQKHDNGEVYEGYAPQKNLQLTDGQWSCLLHNIAVELLLLQGARQPFDAIWRGGRNLTFEWTKKIKILPTATGADLKAPSDGGVREELLAELTTEASSNSVGSNVTIKSIPHLSHAAVLPWMAIRLLDVKSKLAISKRVTQLTGRRIADPILSNAATMEEIFTHLKSKDRPQKLAQKTEFQQMNVDLPNVKIHKSRRTMISKEKQFGRWKLVEAELTARGLPVTGGNRSKEKAVIEPRWSRMGRKLRQVKKAPRHLA